MIRQQYTDVGTIPQHRCKPVSISANVHHFCYIYESVTHCQRVRISNLQAPMQSKIVLWRYCPRHTVKNCLLEIDVLVSPQPRSFRLQWQRQEF
ncbi:putative inactive deaminase [Trichinella pseudospiralis]